LQFVLQVRNTSQFRTTGKEHLAKLSLLEPLGGTQVSTIYNTLVCVINTAASLAWFKATAIAEGAEEEEVVVEVEEEEEEG
jgi:hypothetical protein